MLISFGILNNGIETNKFNNNTCWIDGDVHCTVIYKVIEPCTNWWFQTQKLSYIECIKTQYKTWIIITKYWFLIKFIIYLCSM